MIKWSGHCEKNPEKTAGKATGFGKLLALSLMAAVVMIVEVFLWLAFCWNVQSSIMKVFILALSLAIFFVF